MRGIGKFSGVRFGGRGPAGGNMVVDADVAIPVEPPVWVTEAGSLGSVLEGATISASVSATDPADRTLTYTLHAGDLPEGITIGSDGAFVGASEDAIEEDTDYNFTLRVSNGRKSALREFSLTVLYNEPPEWVTAAGAIVGDYYEGVALSIAFEATDSEGQPLTYTLDPSSDPVGGLTLSLEGVLSGTPTDDLDVDTDYDLVINVTDGKTSVQRTFVLSIQDNDPPHWVTAAGSLGTISVGDEINFVVEATDPENEGIYYEIISGALPDGSSFDLGTGELTGTAETADTYTFTVRANDPQENFADRTFSVTVASAGDVYWDDAVLALAFDDNMTDDTGRHTASNAGSFTTGKYAEAYNVNGVAGVNYTDNIGDFSFGTGDYCMEAWIYPTSLAATDQYLFGEYYTQGVEVYLIGGTNRTNWGPFNMTTNFGLTSTTGILASGLNYYAGKNNAQADTPLNQWSHVAVTRESGTLRFFVNGVKIAEATQSGNIVASTEPFSVGARSAVAYRFSGRIDDLRVYKGEAKYVENFTPLATAMPVG